VVVVVEEVVLVAAMRKVVVVAMLLVDMLVVVVMVGAGIDADAVDEPEGGEGETIIKGEHLRRLCLLHSALLIGASLALAIVGRAEGGAPVGSIRFERTVILPAE